MKKSKSTLRSLGICGLALSLLGASALASEPPETTVDDTINPTISDTPIVVSDTPDTLTDEGNSGITARMTSYTYTTNYNGFAYFSIPSKTGVSLYLTNNGTNTITWNIDRDAAYPSSGTWLPIMFGSSYGSIAPGKSLQIDNAGTWDKGDYRLRVINSDGSPIIASIRVNQLNN